MRLDKVLVPSFDFQKSKSAIDVGKHKEFFFLAYGSVNELIIVDSNLKMLQMIQITLYSNSSISCLSCSEEYGNILCSCQNTIWVLTPISSESSDNLHEWRIKFSTEFKEEVNQLSFNLSGSKFVVSHGKYLSLFTFDNISTNSFVLIDVLNSSAPCYLIEFSSDDLFFATVSKDDYYVKVWYDLRKVWERCESSKTLSQFARSQILRLISKNPFSFEYLSHPNFVTSISWRRKVSFCNSDLICNAILTSCEDGINRIWIERLWDFDIQAQIGLSNVESLLFSSISKPESNEHMCRLWPFVSFFVAVLINSPTHLRSYESIEGSENKKFKKSHSMKKFRLNWLNNKEIEVSSYAKFSYNNLNNSHISSDNTSQVKNLNKIRMLNHWHVGPDIVYVISPNDGSFLTWSIDDLDVASRSHSRTPTCFFLSSITHVIPLKMAQNMSISFIDHQPHIISHIKDNNHNNINTDNLNGSLLSESDCVKNDEGFLPFPDVYIKQNSKLFSVHEDGTINSWMLDYSDNRSYVSVQNISHDQNINGPLYNIKTLLAHPYLPFIAVVSAQTENPDQSNCEVFIWRYSATVMSLFHKKWQLLGFCKFDKHLTCHTISWLASTESIITNTINLVVPTKYGICVLSPSQRQCSNLSFTKQNVPIIGACLFGLRLVTVLENSNLFTYCFIHSEKILLSSNRESYDRVNESINFIIALSNEQPPRLHAWEFEIDQADVVLRFQVSRTNSLMRTSSQDQSSQKKCSMYLGNVEVNLNDIRSLSTFIKPFLNPNATSNFISLCCLSNSGKIQLIDISITNSRHSFDEVKSSNREIIIQNPSKIFYGLVGLIETHLTNDFPIAISCFSYMKICILCVQTNLITSENNSPLKLRIFYNRLATEDSWKEEACINVPLTDFGSTINSLEFLKTLNVSLVWNLLEGAGYIVTVAFLGKVFIFASVSPKNAEKDLIKSIDDNINQKINLNWSLLSVYSYEYYQDVPCSSTWSFAGVFLVSSGRTISIFYSNERETPLDWYDAFNSPLKTLNEVGKVLNDSKTRLFFSSLNINAHALLGLHHIVSKHFLDLYNFIKSQSSLFIASDNTSVNKSNDSLKNQFHFKSSVKLNQVILSYFESSNSHHLNQNISNFLKTKFLDDLTSESSLLKTFNRQIFEDFKDMIKNVILDEYDETEMNVLIAFADVFADYASLYQEGVKFDSLGLNFYIIGLLQKKYGLTQYEQLNSFHFICAFHSNSKSDLIQYLQLLDPSGLTWSQAQMYGLVWWIPDDQKRKLIELIAKGEYQKSQDPLDAALFYLLLNKRSVIGALFKSKRNTKMTGFFSQDFTADQVKLSAIKNGYYLLTIHRFIHAIVFFILGDKIWEAIQICISSLKDIQLAYLIAQSFKETCFEKFITESLIKPTFSDPFLRSIGFWVLERPLESLITLIDKPNSNLHSLPVMIKLQQLCIFEHLLNDLKIKKHFSYEKQGLVTPLMHGSNKITPDYLQSSYNRLLYSSIHNAINLNLPNIALVLSFRGYFCHKIELLYDISLRGKESKGPLTFQTSWNLKTVSRSLLFSALFHCFLDDIQDSNQSLNMNSIFKNIQIFKIFCVDHILENQLTITKLRQEIDQICQTDFDHDDHFDILKKYSLIIVMAIRHFSLYDIGKIRIIYQLIMIYSEIESFSKKRSNVIKEFPSFFVLNPGSVFMVKSKVFLMHLSTALLEYLIKHCSDKYEIHNNSSLENTIIIDNLRKISEILSDSFYIALNGCREINFLSDLIKQKKHIQYSLKDNKIITLTQDVEGFITELIKSKDTETTIQNFCEYFGNSLIELLEIFSCCFSSIFFSAIFYQNPKICRKIYHFLRFFIENWTNYFGGVFNLTMNPSVQNHENIDREIFSFSINEKKSFSFNFFLPPNKKIYDYFIDDQNLSNSNNFFNDSKYRDLYAWQVMTASLCAHTISSLKNMLQQFGIPITRIFSYSSTIHSILVLINSLRTSVLKDLNNYQSPPNTFLPFDSYHLCLQQNVTSLSEYFSDPDKTPFQSLFSQEEAKLWTLLSQDLLLKNEMLLFSIPTYYENEFEQDGSVNSIIHENPNGLLDFCFDQNNLNSLALSTNEEIIELKLLKSNFMSLDDPEITYRLSSNSVLAKYVRSIKPKSKKSPNYVDKTTEIYKSYPSFSPVIVRKKLTRNNPYCLLVSHPFESYYLSAFVEPNVCLYQFDVPTLLHQFDSNFTKNEKIVSLNFNENGNKFGLMNEAGFLSLFLFNTCANQIPFFQQECHNKFGTSFCFLGASSLIATSGHSSESLDVSLWDTLMPSRCRQVCSFLSHEHGCTRVVYSPLNQSLVIGGRKGGLFVFDLRKFQMITSLPNAHDVAVSYLCVDQNQIASGAIDGTVKIWTTKKTLTDSVEMTNSFQTVQNESKTRDSIVHSLKFYENYLFISSNGVLSVRQMN